jgi:hypothetical protein
MHQQVRRSVYAHDHPRKGCSINVNFYWPARFEADIRSIARLLLLICGCCDCCIVYKELRTTLGLGHVLGNNEYALTFVSVKNNAVLIVVIIINLYHFTHAIRRRSQQCKIIRITKRSEKIIINAATNTSVF